MVSESLGQKVFNDYITCAVKLISRSSVLSASEHKVAQQSRSTSRLNKKGLEQGGRSGSWLFGS